MTFAVLLALTVAAAAGDVKITSDSGAVEVDGDRFRLLEGDSVVKAAVTSSGKGDRLVVDLIRIGDPVGSHEGEAPVLVTVNGTKNVLPNKPALVTDRRVSGVAGMVASYPVRYYLELPKKTAVTVEVELRKKRPGERAAVKLSVLQAKGGGSLPLASVEKKATGGKKKGGGDVVAGATGGATSSTGAAAKGGAGGAVASTGAAVAGAVASTGAAAGGAVASSGASSSTGAKGSGASSSPGVAGAGASSSMGVAGAGASSSTGVASSTGGAADASSSSPPQDEAAGPQGRLVVLSKDDMGEMFRLRERRVLVDGKLVMNESAYGEDTLAKTLIAFDGAVPTGKHDVAINLVYAGHGGGVFSYMEGYVFHVNDGRNIQAIEDQVTRVTFVSKEQGGIFTEIEDRPTIQTDVRTEAAPAP